jgi:NAD kinase
MPGCDKVVLVTRKTELDELVERFNTRAQARFLLEKRGSSFNEIESAHSTYHVALATVKGAVPRGIRMQTIDRGVLPNFLFGRRDLVVTLGPDGLVVNTAKYLREQPLLAFNPDPARLDGVLIPFLASEAPQLLPAALEEGIPVRPITMAMARLDDGQVLYAVNDLFVGQRTHVSARYHLTYRRKSENQSSSGIIISTGAGSTGWYRSVLTGASGVVTGLGASASSDLLTEYRFDAGASELRFSVREPFVSRVSAAEIVFGRLRANDVLVVASQMPHGGVIFSDGMESDFLNFESGRTARISVADRSVLLLARQESGR